MSFYKNSNDLTQGLGIRQFVRDYIKSGRWHKTLTAVRNVSYYHLLWQQTDVFRDSHMARKTPCERLCRAALSLSTQQLSERPGKIRLLI